MQLGDPEKGRQLLEESRELFRDTGFIRGEATALGGLGYVKVEQGDLPGAVALLSESAEMAAEIGFTWWQVGMLMALVECLIELGRVDEAVRHSLEQLRLARELGDRQSMVVGVAQQAWIASTRGEAERTGRWWGAVEAEEARAPLGQWEDEREKYLGRVLGGQGLEHYRDEGRRLSLAAAVEEVLAGGRAAAGA